MQNTHVLRRATMTVTYQGLTSFSGSSFNPHNGPMMRCYYYPYFAEWRSKSQRGFTAWPRSHSSKVTALGFLPKYVWLSAPGVSYDTELPYSSCVLGTEHSDWHIMGGIWVTKKSDSWSIPSFTWGSVPHKTPCHWNLPFLSQILPSMPSLEKPS